MRERLEAAIDQWPRCWRCALVILLRGRPMCGPCVDEAVRLGRIG